MHTKKFFIIITVTLVDNDNKIITIRNSRYVFTVLSSNSLSLVKEHAQSFSCKSCKYSNNKRSR